MNLLYEILGSLNTDVRLPRGLKTGLRTVFVSVCGNLNT